MKFSEVIAALEKDPGKKFELYKGDRKFVIRTTNTAYNWFILDCHKDGEVYRENVGCSTLSGNIHTYDVWEEVKPAIEVGDKVKIVDVGKSYSTYCSWFKENNVDVDIVARYQYGRFLESVSHVEEMEFKVLAKGEHESEDKMLYAIESPGCGVYLIGEDGIKKVTE